MHSHTPDILSFPSKTKRELLSQTQLDSLKAGTFRILEEIGLEVAASAGAACHADSVEISHVLKAMDIPLEWAKGTIRFSVGRMTTKAEIDKTIRVVADAVNKLKAL